MATLSGPRQPPASGGPARQLVVLLHGVGSNGEDLIELAPYLAPLLPDAAFVAPDGWQPYDMAPFGRQWFSLRDPSAENVLTGLRSAEPVLNAFLDEELAALGLSDDRLALIGFSQGTMLALHCALRRPRPCAAVLGYSGLLSSPETLRQELRSRPPVLLVHGEEDEVVPHAFLPAAHDALERLGVPVLALSRPGLGHSLDEEGLKAGIRFVAQSLSGSLSSGPARE